MFHWRYFGFFLNRHEQNNFFCGSLVKPWVTIELKKKWKYDKGFESSEEGLVYLIEDLVNTRNEEKTRQDNVSINGFKSFKLGISRAKNNHVIINGYHKIWSSGRRSGNVRIVQCVTRVTNHWRHQGDMVIVSYHFGSLSVIFWKETWNENFSFGDFYFDNFSAETQS